MKKILTYVAAAAMAATGLAVATASPAFAAGGCSSTSNPTIATCVNHGDDGNSTRGDFYIYRTPDTSIWTYKASFVVNGVEGSTRASGRITRTGRWCCTYTSLATLPISTKTVKNRVRLYTQSGALHMTVDSPTISVRN
jgi:hypothetical protein